MGPLVHQRGRFETDDCWSASVCLSNPKNSNMIAWRLLRLNCFSPLPVNEEVSLCVGAATQRLADNVTVPQGTSGKKPHTRVIVASFSWFLLHFVWQCRVCVCVCLYWVWLVDLLHEFFGRRQVAVSDLLDEDDVVAVDDLDKQQENASGRRSPDWVKCWDKWSDSFCHF